MSKRLSWNEYFASMAEIVAARGTCDRLKVGAIIIKDNRIIATGYNGGIYGDEHCIDVGCKIVDNHCIRTIHAEENAIIQCARYGSPTENTEIYVTHFPCMNCSKSIIQAGIKEILYTHDYRNNPYAKELFEKAGVKITKI